MTTIPFTLDVALLSQATTLAQPEIYQSIENANEENSFLLSVPYIHQYSELSMAEKARYGWTACGPTSLTMLMQFEGVNISLSDVLSRLPSSVYRVGVGFADLKSGLKVFGFEAEELDMSVKSISEAVLAGSPVAVNIQNYVGVNGHEIVVVGVYQNSDGEVVSLIVNDPSTRENERFDVLSDRLLKSPQGFNTPLGGTKPFIIAK
jgi:hypothetical protein